MAIDNTERIRKAYRDFNEGRIGEVLDALDENIDWEEPGWLFMPRARHHGTAAVQRGVFETVPRNWDSFRIAPRDLFGFGDKVLALGEFVGRLTGSGEEVHVPFAHLWTFRYGKVVKGQAFIDVSEIQSALEQRRAA